MKNYDELEDRLVKFAVGIIKLTEIIPDIHAGNHIAKQLLRSGTSPASNYGEARGAESRADFIHKLGIVAKEINESGIWLNIIEGSSLLKKEYISDLRNECAELGKIIVVSIKTAKKNANK